MARWVALSAVCIVLALGQEPAAAAVPQTFRISGEVHGLFPGFVGTLPARVTNPYGASMRLATLDTSWPDAAPGCPAALLAVGPGDLDVVIPAGVTAPVALDLRLDEAAPDACQDVVFQLAFTGVAVVDDRPGGTLPETGAAVGTLLLVAAGMIAFGWYVSRRRPGVP